MILWQRKAYRLVMGSVFPLVYYFSSKIPVLIVTGFFLSLMVFFEIERLKHPGVYKWVLTHLGGIFKVKVGKLTGTTYFLIATFVLILFFERGVAIASLLFLILGDAASTLVGVNYGRIKLFKGKTLEGSLAFLAIDLLVGLLLLTLPKISIELFVLLSGAFAATLMELLPLQVDDNLTVGIFSAVIMQIGRIV